MKKNEKKNVKAKPTTQKTITTSQGNHLEPDVSPVYMTELVLPSHTNALGTIFGGVVMGWIDIAGAISAQKYARSPVVTVSVDYLHFITPIKIGYTVLITSKITFVGKTSMEVHVEVKAQNSITGSLANATQAYLTYVSVDEFGRPRTVPPMDVQTNKQKEDYKKALKRRTLRLSWKNNLHM